MSVTATAEEMITTVEPVQNELRNQLVLRHLDIPDQVWAALYHFGPVRRMGREDVVAEGRRILVQAASTYNPALSKFRQWAYYKVRFGVLDAAYANQLIQIPHSVVKAMFRGEESELIDLARHAMRRRSLCEAALGIAAHDEVSGQDVDDDVRRALGQLSDKQRTAITLLFGIGCQNQPVREVAALLGCSEQMVFYHRRQGLNELASYLSQYAAESSPAPGTDAPGPSADAATPVPRATAAAHSPA